MKKFKMVNKETKTKVLFSINEDKSIKLYQVKQGNNNVCCYSHDKAELLKALSLVGLKDYYLLSECSYYYNGIHNLANFKYHFNCAVDNINKTFIFIEDINDTIKSKTKFIKEIIDNLPTGLFLALEKYLDFNSDKFKYKNFENSAKHFCDQVKGNGAFKDQVFKNSVKQFFTELEEIRNLRRDLDVKYGDNKPVYKREIMTFDKFKTMYNLSDKDLGEIFQAYITGSLSLQFELLQKVYNNKLNTAYDLLINKVG